MFHVCDETLLTPFIFSLVKPPTCSHAENVKGWIVRIQLDPGHRASQKIFSSALAPKLPTHHRGTLKTLLNGPFQLGAQARTNTFIHGVPEMQMKRSPDTFTRVALSWFCVRHQRGYHSSRVMQGTTPMVAVAESEAEPPQTALSLSHRVDVANKGQTG